MSPKQHYAFSGSALAILNVALVCSMYVTSAADPRELVQIPTEFPPGCKCERLLANGPYRLENDESMSTPISNYNRYCFNIMQTTCNVSSACCNPDLGIYKVELDVVSGCKSALKHVTVNGNPYSSWEYNSALGTMRLTRLNLTAGTARNAQICYFLKADSNCTTLHDLCAFGGGACKYSIFNPKRDCCPVGIVGLQAPQFIVPATNRPDPPSPAPPAPARSDFPNCICERDPTSSRLYIKPNVTTAPTEKNLTKICFTVGSLDVCPNPASSCCSFSLYKLEFEADPACARYLAYSTVYGEKRMRFFQLNPYPVLKVTGINKEFAQAADMEVCLYMRAPCNTLTQLGKFHDGSITVGIFNKPGSLPATCCPLFNVQ